MCLYSTLNLLKHPVLSAIDLLIMPLDTAPDPATPFRMVGSIMYDREENGYNLEWESRADFQNWLSHEQRELGIEI